MVEKLDLSQCICDKPGWCPVFEKEMGTMPPNWKWCQDCSQHDREEHFERTRKSVTTLVQSTDPHLASLINFYDELPPQQSEYAVCVVAANDYALEHLSVTRESIVEYAKLCNADYIELTGDQNQDWPMGNKYRIYQVTKKYKKTLYLDCDIFVKSGSPNIFKNTPDDKISAYDEFKDVTKKQKDLGWLRSIEKWVFANILDEPYESTVDNMLNGGGLVIPQSLADLYRQPQKCYIKEWCFDQVLLSCLVPEELLNRLSFKWNCEFEAGPTFWSRSCKSHFIHVNNVKQQDKRLRFLSMFSDSESDPKVSLLMGGKKPLGGGVERWNEQFSNSVVDSQIIHYYDDKQELCSDIIICWLMGHNIHQLKQPEYHQPFGHFNKIEIAPIDIVLRDGSNLSNKKIISVVHNPIEWEYKNALAVNPLKIVCVSQLCKSGLKTYLTKNSIDYLDKDIVVINNAPDPSRIDVRESRFEDRKHLKIQNHEKLIVCLSRINPQKNLEALIKSSDLLPSSYKIVIAGSELPKNKLSRLSVRTGSPRLINWTQPADGLWERYHDEYVKYIHELAASRINVSILPSQNDVSTLFNAADLYVQPSRYEGFGLSPVEAMMYRIPVLGTNTGILSEMPCFKLNYNYNHLGEQHTLGQETTAEDIASSIVNVFSNKNKSDIIVNECYNKAKTMQDSFVAQWRSLLRSLNERH